MGSSEDEQGNPIRWESPTGFELQWRAKGWGFGCLGFGRRDDGGEGLYCGDEYMGMENAAKMLKQFAEKTPPDEWPQLLKEYGSAEKLLEDVKDWESRPGRR